MKFVSKIEHVDSALSPPANAASDTADISDITSVLSEIDTKMAPGASPESAAADLSAAIRTEEDARTSAIGRGLSTEAEFRSRLYWFIGVSDATSQDPGSLTYEPYFGLREKPFSLSSDPRFFFSDSSHGAAFDMLAAGIRRREGVLVLTGEVGTGKTTLCRAVLQSLGQRIFAAYVPDPFLSREDLLKTLLVDFGVVSVDDIRSGRLRGASRADLSFPLYEFLASLQPLKAFAVVMIDEAQNLTAELLEEIRILSDLDNGQKLLEVVLIGQPELQTRLATTQMRQLRQRVSIRCALTPLAREEVAAYISHRLTVAGNDGTIQFTDAATDLVCAASTGIPRVINLLCDRALRRAAHYQTTRVDAEHVVWAVEDLKVPVTETLLVPDWDQTGVSLESFPSESQQAPQLADQPLDGQPQPPPIQAAPPASSGAVADSPGDFAETTTPLADLSTPEPARPVDDGHDADVPTTAARMSAIAPSPAAARRRRGSLAVAAACLAAALGVGYWYSSTISQQPEALAQREPPRSSPQPVPAVAPNRPTPPPVSQVTGSPSPTPAPAGAGTQTSAAVPAAPAFALQMATFQRPARTAQAVQELRDAGFRAYSLDVVLSGGTHALAVLIGPYPDAAAAERDLERARQVPGYAGGRVVPVSPSTPPPASRD